MSSDETVQVEAEGVIKLMLQFCKENKLQRTMQTLHEETGVSLSTVDSPEAFVNDVLQGRWDSVINCVSVMNITPKKLGDLYEHVVLEMIELEQREVARTMLRHCKPLLHIRTHEETRYKRLMTLADLPFDAAEAYGGVSRQKRRKALAKALVSEVDVVPPGRLMQLLAYALKWQRFRGLLSAHERFDVFSGRRGDQVADVTAVHEDDQPVSRQHSVIKLGEGAHAHCAVFTPDGTNVISGSSDGFVEVWDVANGRLCPQLEYQQRDELMMHDAAVTAVAISADNELLLTADAQGAVKAWHFTSGSCVREYAGAHSDAVTGVLFTREQTQFVTCSNDSTVRLHGLRSGKTLKVMRGHTSFVNGIALTADGSSVVSVSSDHEVRVWSVATAQCSASFHVQSLGAPTVRRIERSIVGICALHASTRDHFVVVNGTRSAYIVDDSGSTLAVLDADVATSEAAAASAVEATLAGDEHSTVSARASRTAEGGFIACSASCNAEYIYCLSASGQVVVFNRHSCAVESMFATSGDGGAASGVALAHHPRKNMLATMTKARFLKLWTP